jgi:inosose dehydratase
MNRRAFVMASCVPAFGAAPPLRLGIGTYTFHNLSVEAMVAELVKLGVTEIEMSRGEFMNFTHPPAERFHRFRRMADAAGIRCVSYYAPTIKERGDLDAAIAFARILGAGNISGDPTGAILKEVDRRVAAEGLTFGIHNHYFKQRGFAYESPEDVLRALDGLSPAVGCTLDVGHIVSCGFDTLDAVRKLGPRLKLVHLKDIQAAGEEVNVLLGQGRARIPEVLAELRKLRFQGLIALEYEKDGDISDDVRRQMEYARKLT